jgi:site-specific recombinase XerD
MSSALAEALADADDPETVQQILTLVSDDSSDQSFDTQPALSTLYERYLSRRQNRAPTTIAQYKRTIPSFIQFTEDSGVTHPGQLTTEPVDNWVDELFDTYDNDSTVLTYTKNVRAWLKWIHRRNFCDDHIYQVLNKDELGLSPTVRDEALPIPEAQALLQKLRQQRFGTAIHALLELVWNTGLRIGEVRALDLRDFSPEEETIYVRHRPETGTRIKNGSEDEQTSGDGERHTTIDQEPIDALREYIRTDRKTVTDEFRRKPLFTTGRGRAARSTLRRWIYEATSCRWADQDSGDISCDGSCDPRSNVCPYSYYPHAIRRGAIVSHLSGGLRLDKAAGRFDVSPRVIRKHYDPREKSRRRQDRVDAVRDAWDNM